MRRTHLILLALLAGATLSGSGRAEGEPGIAFVGAPEGAVALAGVPLRLDLVLLSASEGTLVVRMRHAEPAEQSIQIAHAREPLRIGIEGTPTGGGPVDVDATYATRSGARVSATLRMPVVPAVDVRLIAEAERDGVVSSERDVPLRVHVSNLAPGESAPFALHVGRAGLSDMLATLSLPALPAGGSQDAQVLVPRAAIPRGDQEMILHAYAEDAKGETVPARALDPLGNGLARPTPARLPLLLSAGLVVSASATPSADGAWSLRVDVANLGADAREVDLHLSSRPAAEAAPLARHAAAWRIAGRVAAGGDFSWSEEVSPSVAGVHVLKALARSADATGDALVRYGEPGRFRLAPSEPLEARPHPGEPVRMRFEVRGAGAPPGEPLLLAFRLPGSPLPAESAEAFLLADDFVRTTTRLLDQRVLAEGWAQTWQVEAELLGRTGVELVPYFYDAGRPTPIVQDDLGEPAVLRLDAPAGRLPAWPLVSALVVLLGAAATGVTLVLQERARRARHAPPSSIPNTQEPHP